MYSVHPVRQNQKVSKPVWPQNHQTSIESCAQCPLEALHVSCASQSCGSDNSYPTVSWVIGPVHRRLTWYDGKKWQAATVTCKMQGITTSVLKHKVFQDRESVFVKATFEYRSHFQEKQKRKLIAPNAVDVYTLLSVHQVSIVEAHHHSFRSAWGDQGDKYTNHQIKQGNIGKYIIAK